MSTIPTTTVSYWVENKYKYQNSSEEYWWFVMGKMETLEEAKKIFKDCRNEDDLRLYRIVKCTEVWEIVPEDIDEPDKFERILTI